MQDPQLAPATRKAQAVAAIAWSTPSAWVAAMTTMPLCELAGGAPEVGAIGYRHETDAPGAVARTSGACPVRARRVNAAATPAAALTPTPP